MKRNKIALAGVGLLAAGALALAGCSSKTGGDTTPTKGGDSKAIIKVSGNEPENPLIPTNTNEVGGGKILDSIFAGLAYYDAKGKLVNDMAESIKVDDPSDLTIKLKEGNTFSNGEKVTADSFINAWQYGALFSNKQLNQSWFSDIEGFSDSADSPLTGLKKTDDYTFSIKLSNPVAADFSQRLGYSAYYPLPEAGLKDMATFGENPIGNGPYKLAKTGAWQHKIQLDLVKNDTYKGGRQAKNGGLTFVFYASADAEYADLQSNKVDVIDQIPSSAQQTFESDLGDRAVNQPAAIFQSFSIPGNLEHFTGDEGKLRREAISMAIDRAAITKTIFNNTRTPASDFTSPVIAGWSDSLKGADVLKFDAKKAKELWAEADKISPWSGKFQIAYNSDSAHQAWVDAVSNQLKNNLGIDASGNPYVDFASLRKDVNARSIKTAFRTGWQADYPAQYNFLQPLYSTKASSNDTDYSNPDFDKLVAKGASESDQSAATKDYQQAQELLLKDLPAIPLWYSNVNGGFAKGVNNVQFGWNSVPLYYEITKG
ncbi:peptide ABC transporter substrate-binding protein [Microbacterium azadirachtae]|uniref:Oligopeptide-binding protein OppA n=1 Tax=Microbacterium azadirachtae TaxID=582680 RepID=A0A0F0KNM9_9MICO|nr:ABC transporter substrate-binding protein [Microbacterium azadirachtae]KJL20846.1 Oligopeptide-binding protein OppA precursor [Microbacterium azadirachtae]UXW87003.1 ABC transporter substrate-binding protein [Microbacterium azadirachtae]SDM28068.1 oligopeptide transport system substrate-binding protein [Microbacterium azadirachtae]SEG48838.1 oligopeptide transport system substrate-binding protein [Microbacterium azadirachtae]SEG51146.1 oligopeptide transport system substrate-binding protein